MEIFLTVVLVLLIVWLMMTTYYIIQLKSRLSHLERRQMNDHRKVIWMYEREVGRQIQELKKSEERPQTPSQL